MVRLFQTETGTPISFYLADLPDSHLEKYTFLVETNGGMVESIAKENVLIFTLPARAFKFKFVFSVKFIEDCVDHQRILDINNYYVGDSRLKQTCQCLFSKKICGSKSCLLDEFKTPKVPESQEGTSKRAVNISPISLRKKRAKPIIESSDGISDMEDGIESNEDDLSDSSEDAECIIEPSQNNNNKLPQVPRNLKVLGKIITPEIMEWIQNLNAERPKDEFGYPKRNSCIYDAWETRNLIDFVDKTKSIDLVFSMKYFSDVAKLKLLPKSRNRCSLYNHFHKIIINKITELRVSSEIKREFVRAREAHKGELQKGTKS